MPERLFSRILAISITCYAFLACSREDFFDGSDALLRFSADTVTFDTIFTTIGSATLGFKVYNPYAQPLLIDSIYLASGEQSPFRLNIDGKPLGRVAGVKILSRDSLYIFVAVTVDPTNSDNPVIIKDSVVFITNGNYQYIKLIAFGQDVNLVNGKIIGTQRWTGSKPYLIYNSMAVDTGQTLEIEEGTCVMFHRNSSLIVWGNIIVKGTREKPVVFRHDRQEEYYDIIPGQWGTLYIDPISKGNSFSYAIIRNSIAGIQIGMPQSDEIPELELANSIIENVSFAGIYAFGASLSCYNTVISNCAGPALALLRGGRYKFMHCTVSNNGVIGSPRTSASIRISNYFNNPEPDPLTGSYIYVPYASDLEEATFDNCIIYGNANHEFEFFNNSLNRFNYRLDHCLVKAVEELLDTADKRHYNELIFNKNPMFINDTNRYHIDLRPDSLSPAIDAGSDSLLLAEPVLRYDFDGQPRYLDNAPDLGAFERKTTD